MNGLRVEKLGRDDWIARAAGFRDLSIRQTWDFGVLSAERVGAVSEHVAVVAGSETIALADVRVKRLPVLGGGLAYVTGGPLTQRSDARDPALFLTAIEALRAEYAAHRGMVLRVLPPIGPPSWNRDLAAALAGAGFRETTASRVYRTMLVDVTRPPAELRKGLHQKWRNCLNRSEKEHLTVRVATDADAMLTFAAMFEEFVARKGFDVELGASFYAQLHARLPENERLVVLLCEREGKVVAGLLGSCLGDTFVYLLGATSPEALTCKAAYLLQWRAMETARDRGCAWYDLGGIDPAGNPGVFHFKEGLGGEDVTAAGPVEWSSGLRAPLVLALEARIKARRQRAAVT